MEMPEQDFESQWEVLPERADGTEPEPIPTAAEVLAEAAELGAMLVETWWRAAGKLTEVTLVEPMRRVSHLAAIAASPRRVEAVVNGGSSSDPERLRGSLRDRGAELLRRSADISYEQEQHPAYLRILDQMAPDEARILRLLATQGPQPVVDVKVGVPGLDRGVASAISMIGATSGCRYPDRYSVYLDNLVRLGLVSLNTEPVPDPQRYQLLEAQPEVLEARKQAGKLGRTVRRSLDLTPFGRDFCRLCLPLEPESR